MFTRFVIIWILLMTLVSCTPNPTENLNQLIQNSVTPFPSKTPPREKKTATPSLTHTPTNTSTNTATPTPTLTPSPNPSVTPGMIKPELVTICPPIPEVPIDEMDLSGHLVVQMYGGNEGEIPLSESGLVIVSFEDLIPRPVQDSAERNGVGLFRVYQSQNNEFITLTYRNQATTKTQVWHSTWDGSIQTKVFEDVFEQNDDLWQFAGLGTKYLVFRRDWTEFPLFVFDYVAGEKLKIPEFEEGIYIRAPFIVNDIPYLVGLRGDDLINEIQLYNLADFSSLPVLQWLKEEMNYLFSKIEFSGGKLFVVVPQKNSVDFGINLDLETIQSSLDYGDVMKSYVLLGENGEADRWMMIEGVPINNQSSYLFWDASQTNSHIYRLDFGTHILYQYCYTQKSGSEEWSYKALSFDEKYIAFTHTTGILNETVTSVEILNLQTGQFAIIPDANYRVIGWGLAVP